MGCELHPVILNHVLQSVIATQGRKASFSGELLHITADNIVEAVLLEGSILIPDHFELPIDLPKQKSALDELEREVVELQKLKIAFNEEGIFIWRKFSSGNLHEDPSKDLDDDSRDVQSE